MPFCENCGNKVSETAKFCSNCGTKVNCNGLIPEIDKQSTNDPLLSVSNDSKKTKKYLEEDLSSYLIDRREMDFLKASKSSFDGKLKYGYINRKGEWVIQPNFDEVEDISGLIDYNFGKTSSLYKDIYTKAKLNDKWGFINIHGDWVIQPIYDLVTGFNGKYFSHVNLNGKIGYINRKGEWFGKFVYDNNGYLLKKENDKWGFVNQKGEWIIKPEFKKLNEFDNKDFALAKQNGKWGFIDRNGYWIIQPEFEKLIEFRLDNAIAQFSGKCGVINRKGEWVINPHFDEINNISYWWFGDTPINIDSFSYYHVKLAEKSGIIDNTGNWFVPLQLSEIEIDSNDNSKYRNVKLNNKWGIISVSGGWAIKPEFGLDDHPQYYNEIDKACVASQNGKFGYINSQGSWIIKPNYDGLGNFHEGDDITDFEEDECYGLINRNGKVVVDAEFGSIESSDFRHNNFARASDADWNWGLINKKGDWILQPEFDDIDFFDESGMAKAKIGDKYGWIDQNGWVIQPIFDDVWIDPNEGDNVTSRDNVTNSYNESPIKPKDGAGIR